MPQTPSLGSKSAERGISDTPYLTGVMYMETRDRGDAGKENYAEHTASHNGTGTHLGSYGWESHPKVASYQGCHCDACYRDFTSHGPACICIPCIQRDMGKTLVPAPCYRCGTGGTGADGSRWYYEPTTGTLHCRVCNTVCKQDVPSTEGLVYGKRLD